MRRSTRYAEAFKENANILGLAGIAAVSIATLNPLPLLAGLVAEAVYILFVPDSEWYEARLAKRYDAEVEKRRQQLKDQVLPLLRPTMQQRFSRLEEMRAQIGAQPIQEETWFREVLRKLDYLLEKFLLFAGKEAQFRSYLRSVAAQVRGGKTSAGEPEEADIDTESDQDRRARRGVIDPRQRPASPSSASGQAQETAQTFGDRWVQQMVTEARTFYDREMAGIKRLMEQEQDPNTKAVLEKRLDVLQRRQEFVGKIGKILANLNHQLELLEDTFGLINDELRARSPEQVLSDIEDVVWQTNTMTQVLEELAPYEQLEARITT